MAQVKNLVKSQTIALIKGGYRHERTFVAKSPEGAKHIADFVAPLDEFAVIAVDENLVSVLTAKSQKRKRLDGDGMDKAEFEASKDAVLRVCGQIIGVDPAELLQRRTAPSISSARERQQQRVFSVEQFHKETFNASA